MVGTEGSFGTLPDGLQIYLDKYHHSAPQQNQIIVLGGKAVISDQLRKSAKERPTYFIANKSRFSRFYEGLELIRQYPKAPGDNLNDAILLFKILPPED